MAAVAHMPTSETSHSQARPHTQSERLALAEHLRLAAQEGTPTSTARRWVPQASALRGVLAELPVRAALAVCFQALLVILGTTAALAEKMAAALRAVAAVVARLARMELVETAAFATTCRRVVAAVALMAGQLVAAACRVSRAAAAETIRLVLAAVLEATRQAPRRRPAEQMAVVAVAVIAARMQRAALRTRSMPPRRTRQRQALAAVAAVAAEMGQPALVAMLAGMVAAVVGLAIQLIPTTTLAVMERAA